MKKKTAVIIALCLLFAALWLLDILPPEVAKIPARIHMNAEEFGETYRIEYAEYSPAHDSYFVYFSGGPSSGGEIEIDYAIEVDHAVTGQNFFRIRVQTPKFKQ